MGRNKTVIRLTPEDERKIIRQLSGRLIPPIQEHKNKKTYSRHKKFKKQNIW